MKGSFVMSKKKKLKKFAENAWEHGYQSGLRDAAFVTTLTGNTFPPPVDETPESNEAPESQEPQTEQVPEPNSVSEQQEPQGIGTKNASGFRYKVFYGIPIHNCGNDMEKSVVHIEPLTPDGRMDTLCVCALNARTVEGSIIFDVNINGFTQRDIEDYDEDDLALSRNTLCGCVSNCFAILTGMLKKHETIPNDSMYINVHPNLEHAATIALHGGYLCNRPHLFVGIILEFFRLLAASYGTMRAVTRMQYTGMGGDDFRPAFTTHEMVQIFLLMVNTESEDIIKHINDIAFMCAKEDEQDEDRHS